MDEEYLSFSEEKVKLSEITGKILKYMRPYWGGLIFVLILAMCGSLLNVVSPWFISRITAEIQTGLTGILNLEAIKRLAIVYIVILALYFVFTYVQNLMTAKITQMTAKKMRSDIKDRKSVV